MDCAQFKTMREALGYTALDVAAAMGVSERTARRWEITITPPADAQEWIQAEWDATVEEVRAALDALDDDPVHLARYRSQRYARRAGERHPVKRHAAIRGLLAFCLSLENRPWQIDYDSADD